MEALGHFIERLRFSLSCKKDYKAFADALKACGAVLEPKIGKGLHGFVVKLGLLSCQVVLKSLLNMYAKCGEMGDSRKLFSGMKTDDAVVWNIVLSGFAGSRVYDAETMRFFKEMQCANEVKPTPVTFAILLPVCARLGDSYVGKCVHSYVIKTGHDADTLVGNALVSMYAKCGLVSYDAYAAFDSIPNKDVVSWNAIISGFSENKMMEDAFRFFCLMLKGPTEPNYATIANILPVCASLPKCVAYHFGREIHGYLWQRPELQMNVFVCNALVSFYLRVGWMKEATSLFGMMESRDLVSWNAVIAGYSSNDEWLKAMELFRELIYSRKIGPDSVTLVSVLPVCAQLKNLRIGKEIHGYALRHPCLLDDTSVGNAVINFYTKCGDTRAAYCTFQLIPKKDLISWNSILDAVAGSRCCIQFLHLLHQMLDAGNDPDSITILSIINFCTNVLSVEKVKETHSYTIKTGLLLDDVEPTVGNALLDAYSKCGYVEHAFKIFQSLSGKRTLVTYNSMISGYVTSGNHNDAQLLFNKMPETDLTTWNLMVRVYAENSCPGEAICLFREIQAQGMKPDAVTIMSLLPVCAQVASLHLLRQCHAFIIRASFDDVRLKGAVLDLYAKCGSLKTAYAVFQSYPYKDLVMFTAMIGGYAMHGLGKEALKAYSQMLESGVKPDHVIITAILSACSHSGLVDEGLKLFYSIEKVHAMEPTMEQYACLVDLLARGGRINDAYSLVGGMPIEANANVWGTLLGACRNHHEVELGRLVADRLFEVESNNVGNYVLMSNLYAADARWDAVMEMRKLMKARDLKKPAGCSWVEVDGKENVFIAGDCSHPRRYTIFDILNTLYQQIKEPMEFEKINVQ